MHNDLDEALRSTLLILAALTSTRMSQLLLRRLVRSLSGDRRDSTTTDSAIRWSRRC